MLYESGLPFGRYDVSYGQEMILAVKTHIVESALDAFDTYTYVRSVLCFQ